MRIAPSRGRDGREDVIFDVMFYDRLVSWLIYDLGNENLTTEGTESTEKFTENVICDLRLKIRNGQLAIGRECKNPSVN
jgi:hypothetical protein